MNELYQHVSCSVTARTSYDQSRSLPESAKGFIQQNSMALVCRSTVLISEANTCELMCEIELRSHIVCFFNSSSSSVVR